MARAGSLRLDRHAPGQPSPGQVKTTEVVKGVGGRSGKGKSEPKPKTNPEPKPKAEPHYVKDQHLLVNLSERTLPTGR